MSADAQTEATHFRLRPARSDEAGLFFAQHPAEDERLGAIGHVRMDFGRSSNEFWHTWHPRGPEELNTPEFKAELQQVVDRLREDVLKNRFAMERFCYGHGGKIDGGWAQNYAATSTMGRNSPSCVSARTAMSSPMPMTARSRSCQSQSVALAFRLSG